MTGFLDYAGVAAEFGLSVVVVKRRMAAWEKDDFPAPLPWSRRAKRWNPEAVRAWKRRQELRAQSLGAPELRSIAGGRA